jgi:hypothetical protein
MKVIITLLVAILISGCAGVQMSVGQENEHGFTQESDKPYKEVYRIIAKQMLACYRHKTMFGNGYEVKADLDTLSKQGVIELCYVGLTGAQNPEDSIFSRTVTVKDAPNGSIIITTGTTPKYVYFTHKTIPIWLRGMDSCVPEE